MNKFGVFYAIVQVDAEKWTPHRVELAVWTYYLLYNHNQDALTAANIFTHTQATKEEVKHTQRKEPTSRNREEEEGNAENKSASQKRRKSSDEEPVSKKLNV